MEFEDQAWKDRMEARVQLLEQQLEDEKALRGKAYNILHFIAMDHLYDSLRQYSFMVNSLRVTSLIYQKVFEVDMNDESMKGFDDLMGDFKENLGSAQVLWKAVNMETDDGRKSIITHFTFPMKLEPKL